MCIRSSSHGEQNWGVHQGADRAVNEPVSAGQMCSVQKVSEIFYNVRCGVEPLKYPVVRILEPDNLPPPQGGRDERETLRVRDEEEEQPDILRYSGGGQGDAARPHEQGIYLI